MSGANVQMCGPVSRRTTRRRPMPQPDLVIGLLRALFVLRSDGVSVGHVATFDDQAVSRLCHERQGRIQ